MGKYGSEESLSIAVRRNSLKKNNKEKSGVSDKERELEQPRGRGIEKRQPAPVREPWRAIYNAMETGRGRMAADGREKGDIEGPRAAR